MEKKTKSTPRLRIFNRRSPIANLNGTDGGKTVEGGGNTESTPHPDPLPDRGGEGVLDSSRSSNRGGEGGRKGNWQSSSGDFFGDDVEVVPTKNNKNNKINGSK